MILTWSEDWDRWFWKLQTNISDKIWSYVNSEEEEECNLLDLSIRSESANLSFWAWSYVKLFIVYDNICHYYSHQWDQLRETWVYITITVSDVKKTMLESELFIYQKDHSMKSSKSYMLTQTKTLYQDILQSIKSHKLHQWLKKWETITIECIKCDLLKMQIRDAEWLLTSRSCSAN